MPASTTRTSKRTKTPTTKKNKKSQASAVTSKKNNKDATAKSNGLMSMVHSLLGHDKPLLSKQGAEALILWSYTSSPDPSLLAPILYPFWVKFAYFFPKWWSPNLVTVSGFLTIFTMFLVVQKLGGGETGWTIPNGDSAEFPSWLFPAAGIALWLYQTADAVDGRQGKRVGMYVHPSTELFDHGIDSIVTSLVGVTMSTAMGLGHGVWSVLFVAGAWCIFYATTWEHLNVGKMRFQSGLSNPTESLTLICIVFLLVGFYPEFWDLQIIDLWNMVVPESLSTMVSNNFPTVFGYLTQLQMKHAVCIGQFQNGIMSVISSAMVIKKEPRKGITTSIAFQSLLPLLLIGLWLIPMFCLDPSHDITVQFKEHGRLLLLLGAATWNYVTLQLIICEMGKQTFPLAKILSIIFMQLYLLPLVAFYLPAPILNFMLKLYPNFNAVFVLKFFTAISLMRFASLWLTYQNELCYYCGMENWYTIQVWTGVEDGPNKKRLNEKIKYLGGNRNELISEWGTKNERKKRNNMLMKKEMVELM